MKLTKEYLNQLRYFHAIAKGRETGIFDNWETVKKLTNGFSDALQERFGKPWEAVEYLIRHLTLRGKTEKLNLDELETLDSCRKLVDDRWRQEEKESLI